MVDVVVNEKEVKHIVLRAIYLLEREVRLGSYEKEIVENPIILKYVDEVLGDMENAVEWVFDEIKEGKWGLNKTVYSPIT